VNILRGYLVSFVISKKSMHILLRLFGVFLYLVVAMLFIELNVCIL